MVDRIEPDRTGERKRGGGLLWAVLILLLVLAVAWWLWPDGEEEIVVDEEPAAVLDEPATPVDAAGGSAVAAFLAAPEAHIGETLPSTEATVADVPTDRGFWVEIDGQRLFAVLRDQPAERPLDIDAGMSIRLDGGTLRDASYLEQLATPVDADTRRIIDELGAFLVVDESSVVKLDVHAADAGADPLE